MSDFVIQAIGFVGVAMFLLSYQLKSNKALFAAQMTGCGIFFVQFLLLGAYSGCVMLAVNITRNVMLMQYDKREWIKWKGWPYILVGVGTAISLVNWGGFPTVLSIAAMVVSTFAYWTNNAKTIRIAMLTVGAPFMLLYDILVGSWGGVVSETITLASIIISIIRFGWKALDGENWE